MSWKPYRGTSLYDTWLEKERNRYMEFSESVQSCAGFMELSKKYYHWLISLKKLHSIDSSHKSPNFGDGLSERLKKQFISHRELLYKPLLRFMDEE